MKLKRFFIIQGVLLRYGIDRFLPHTPGTRWLRLALLLSPQRWLAADTRRLQAAECLRRALEELGPVFVKFGQIISTRRDLLPNDIADQLALLQDQVAPFPSGQAKRIVECSLGQPIDKLFAHFSSQPLASASVAQVHSATLLDGEQVVVKILRPGIEATIRRDLSLMYWLAKLLMRYWSDGPRLRPVEVVNEFEKNIFDELDLVREAANASQLKRNFADARLLYIPEVYWDYTRQNILVMECIRGLRVSDIEQMHAAQLNMKRLAERGVEIFFTQVFRDNFFHADMHPGNIFVDPSDPEQPRYIAVDFGIVGALTVADQRYLAENLLAFFKRDYRRVATLHIDSAWVPEDTCVNEFESAIRSVCEPIFEKPLHEIYFGQVLLRLFQTARRFNMQVQPQLVLLQKTLLNIEGLGRQLYPQLDLWETAKPFLEKWVSRQKGPHVWLHKLAEHAPQWGNILPQMPQLIHQATQAMVGVEVRHKEQLQLIENLATRVARVYRWAVFIGCTAGLLCVGAVYIVLGALTG